MFACFPHIFCFLFSEKICFIFLLGRMHNQGSMQGFRIHGHSHQSLNLRDSMNGQGFEDATASQFERTLWGERFDGESAPSGKDSNDVERFFSHVRTTTPDDKQL